MYGSPPPPSSPPGGTGDAMRRSMSSFSGNADVKRRKSGMEDSEEKKWSSLTVSFMVFLCLVEMLAGVTVGVFAETWLFSVAAVKGQILGTLIAFIGLAGLIGALSRRAEVLRLSVAAGIVALLFCGQMLNDVSHDVTAECGFAAMTTRIEKVHAALHSHTEPELFAQIMSRMHELENGIDEVDSQGKEAARAKHAKVYMKKAMERDENYLKEKIETLAAHVHHLLDDPITLAVEEEQDRIAMEEGLKEADERDTQMDMPDALRDMPDSVRNATMGYIDSMVDMKEGGDKEGDTKTEEEKEGEDTKTEEKKSDKVEKKKTDQKMSNNGGVRRYTYDGQLCVFPVVYRGAVYHDCVNINNRPMCRTHSSKWQECAPLGNEDDEFQDPVQIIDPAELIGLEKSVDQLNHIADFLESLDEDVGRLTPGDLAFLINVLKNAHMTFESSALAGKLEKERSMYTGGEEGKHELLKNLASELVEQELKSEEVLERFKSNQYELPGSLEEKADVRTRTARERSQADRRKKRRTQFHKKFDRYMKTMDDTRSRMGVADAPEHCLGSRQFMQTFGKITFTLLIVQFMFTYSALSSIFEVEPPRLEILDSLSLY